MTMMPRPLILLAALLFLGAGPAAACTGDCDGDGQVSVAELVRGVGIALGSAPLSGCAAADRDGDGQVRIEELVAALDGALDG